MQCKHCGAKLTQKNLKGGILTCPACGARFRKKANKKRDVPALIIAEIVLIALLAIIIVFLYRQTIA